MYNIDFMNFTQTTNFLSQDSFWTVYQTILH